jgi:hypothetical protein
MDCNGSGIGYCCDTAGSSVTLESNMVESLTRIQYWDDRETPDNTGWYICHFGDTANLLANSPEDVIGPYETQAMAIRVYSETLTLEAEDDKVEKKVRPYDPSRDATPASASIAPSEADPSEELHVELQQAQELRDVPETLQGDRR